MSEQKFFRNEVDRDSFYWDSLERLVLKTGYQPRDLLSDWPSYVQRQTIPRFLSHYEIFKKVIDLPGCVIDLGVYRGSSFFTWSALMETFCPFDVSRRVYGFDGFRGLDGFSDEDGPIIRQGSAYKNAFMESEENIRTLAELHNIECAIPAGGRSQLIVGDVKDTLPLFLKNYPGIKISLLHFDMDLYEPTRLALEHLYPHVVTGGIVCFDEYAQYPWQGETKAVDEYFLKLGKAPRFEKHPFTQTPHAFFSKE